MKTLLASSLLLFVLASCNFYPSSPLNSVVVVTAEVEEPVNPLFFLFGIATLPRTKEPQTEIVHYGGTAFMVDDQLVTALHVVDPGEGGKLLKVTLTDIAGNKAEAKVTRTDKRLDMAALEIVDGAHLWLPSLRLAKEEPDRGDPITQIGNPARMLFVESKGLIVGFDQDQGYNIATLDTYGGNSGGPDLDASGRVIGMCHTLLDGSRFTGIGTWEAIRDFLYPNRIR